ncbi:MAG: O-antigen ligase family protein [bacterium]|nr:O-antigen ligase family protein [bacterium]
MLTSMIIFKLKNISIFKAQHLDIMMLICGITLLLTVSRQGLVLFFLMILFMVFFVKGRKRIFLITALLVIMAISIPVFIQLMAIRERGLELYDIGQRSGLLLGAALMFISNPLLGVGAGGFQQTLISSYYDFLPWGIHGDTLSHTYILTILAEQGLVGFAVFAFFLFFVYRQFIMNYRVKDPKLKTYALVIFSAILIIFISSQAEARFFEEPLLWLFLGLLVALGRLNKNRQINLPEESKEET